MFELIKVHGKCTLCSQNACHIFLSIFFKESKLMFVTRHSNILIRFLHVLYGGYGNIYRQSPIFLPITKSLLKLFVSASSLRRHAARRREEIKEC